MTDDELLRRLQEADPARGASLTDSWITEMTEAIVTTTQVPQTRPRRWLPAVAAAVSVVALGVGGYAVLDQRGDTPPRDQAALTLTLPDQGSAMTSCLQFSVDILRDMPVAFSATATAINEDTVTLDVDHWYRGGTADVVKLAHYDPATVSLDGFAFTEGERYLITSTDGNVNFCGYSAAWSPDMAAAFQEAFEG